MNLDPRSLPEALQDNPPRHPQWALDEAAELDRHAREMAHAADTGQP